MSCYCDYEMPTVSRQSVHRARKPHRCGECGCEIKPGDIYEYAWGVWEGSAQSFRACERCHDARRWVQNNVPCLCWSYGNMLNDCGMAVLDARHRAPAETHGLLFGLFRRFAAITRSGGNPPRSSADFEYGP